jgi:hypothetical protein
MAEEKFKVIIRGPGLSFDQTVDKVGANQIVSFVMTGSVLTNAAATGTGSAAGTARRSASGETASGLDAKQFIAMKKPNTLYERIACLGYFLHTERNTSEFAAKEIRAINKEAAQQPITNLPQRIADTARKYGFIAASGRNKQMTVRGDAVVLALPDREAVTVAMSEHRLGKKRKKSAPKKR